MSYCVNCGVELAGSEQKCPLCGVPVENPMHPWKKPERMPYPKKVEHLMQRVDRRFSAILATIALSIPVICSVLIDIFMTHKLSWSGYVTGAAVCLFVWILLPMLLKRPNVYLLILFDTAALQLYLADICIISVGVMPYVTLAMPLCFTLAAFAYAVTPIIRSKRMQGTLYKPAIIIAAVACLCVLIELIVDLNTDGVFKPVWSLIAASPCLVICAMLILLEGKKKLKDEIIRRLFV